MFFVLGVVLAHFNVIPTVATMAISAQIGISGARRKGTAPGNSILASHLTCRIG